MTSRYRDTDPFWIDPKIRLSIYERDDWTCQLCGGSVDRTVFYLDRDAASLDHIVARSSGGSDDPENLWLAHRGCNSSKNDKPLDEWLERLSIAA